MRIFFDHSKVVDLREKIHFNRYKKIIKKIDQQFLNKKSNL